MRQSYERTSTPPPFAAFVFGALIGAAVAYFTAQETKKKSGGLHIADWLNEHGIDTHHMLDRVKKLLHVRTNGHGFVGGNGHGKTLRRHK